MKKAEIEQLARNFVKAKESDLKRACEDSLIEFTERMWPVIDPATPLVPGRVMDAIALHLEAVAHGNIRRLLITVFPGSSKSTLLSVMFPAWCWGPLRRPWMRFINASYAEHLTTRDNRRMMRVVQHELFTEFWGDVFKLEGIQQAYKFQNDAQGWKLATSVGGVALGERCDCWLVDDPNSPDVESEVVRRATNLWFTEVLPDRLNSMEKSAIIVIQQRLHLEDVAGIALGRDLGYVHLNIPMEYEPNPYVVNAYAPGTDEIVTYAAQDAAGVAEDDIFWRDWREYEGELAWPERFPPKVVEDLKKAKGPVAYSAMYQQRPVPRGGSIIKEDWWQLWKEPKYPALEYLIATLDGAYTEDERNDPSAFTIWGVSHDQYRNPILFLVYAWQEYLEFHALLSKVIASCTTPGQTGGMGGDIEISGHLRFPVSDLIVEKKASGLSIMQEVQRLTGEYNWFNVNPFDPRKYGDKIARLNACQHFFTQKLVWAPDRPYADEVIRQVADFPYSGHDDYVDCTTMALLYLRDTGFTPTRRQIMEEEALEMAYKRDLPPLYHAW